MQNESCPICHQDGIFDYQSASYIINKCSNCDHAYVLNLPSENKILKLYSQWEYWEKDRNHQGITNVAPGTHWDTFISARIGLIEKLGVLKKPPQKILEIGCSEGALLHFYRRRGYEVIGCEINPEIVQKAIQEYRLPIVCSDFMRHDFPRNNYHLIISFHTFEHLLDPIAAIDKCCTLLKKNGKLLIEVPFGSSEYENPDHLHFFSNKSLALLLEKKFDDIHILKNLYTTANGTSMGSFIASATVT